MPINNEKLKVSENKAAKTSNTPNFNIYYGLSNSMEIQRRNSYNIITALCSGRDMLLHVDSSLFDIIAPEREAHAMNFLKVIREMGLDYRYHKISQIPNQSFINKLMGIENKASYSHEIFAFVPQEVWKNETFAFSLPPYGVKYCILSNASPAQKLLDGIYTGQLPESEINSYFELTAFDCCSYGQIGIYTDILSLAEIENLLRT